ncbi:MAG TPA: chemotaxis protein CheW [Polyangiaceae bacterium]
MTHLLPLQVQSVSVAIDARQVQEIMGQRAAVFLPGARSEIPGVVAWRGRAVGVFDFAAVTDGLTPLDEGPPRSRTLVVQVGANTLAVPVDAVREVREVTDECIRAPRVTAQKFAAAEVELDGVVMPIFDFAAFIDSIVVDEPMALAPMAKG